MPAELGPWLHLLACPACDGNPRFAFPIVVGSAPTEVYGSCEP